MPMNKNIKSPAGFLLIPILLTTLVIFGTSCSKPPVDVRVDGKTIDENFLKQENPDLYIEFREEYKQLLQKYYIAQAREHLFKLEAKSQNINVKDYKTRIQQKGAAPTEVQVRMAFDRYKNHPRYRGEKYEDIRNEIAGALKQQSGQQALQMELQRLQKKFSFKVVVHEDNVQPAQASISDKGEPIRANPEAKVTVVEFSDFECPYCGQAQQTARQIRDKYGDKIRWVVKDFPLSFHRQAMAAHIASNCVLKQNKDAYWKFYDSIFAHLRPELGLVPEITQGNANPNILKPAQLEQNALSFGIDKGQYRSCIKDPAVAKEITDDISEGERVGVRGTPSIYVNGYKTKPTVEHISKRIDEALN